MWAPQKLLIDGIVTEKEYDMTMIINYGSD